MLFPTLLMAGLALIAMAVAFRNGQLDEGFKVSWHLTLEILPLMVFAMLLAGMAQVIIPQEMIVKWVGKEAGMRGILLATVAGGFCPGGPYVSFPLVLTLLRAGASIPTLVAFLTSWSLWAVSRLAMEVGFLGWRFVFIRLLSVVLFPIIAGMIAQVLIKIF